MDLTMPMRCPKGHLSTDVEYCSECGAKMPDAASGLGGTVTSGLSAPSASAVGDSDRVCPDCGTPRANATAVFCEVCRYNFVTQMSWATPTVSSPPPPPLAASIPVPSAPLGLADAPAAASTVPSMAAASFAPPASGTVVSPVTPAAPPNVAPSDAAPPIENQQSKIENQNGLTQAPILRWEVVVSVDPSLYTDPDPQIPCPIGEPERVYSLDFADNLIGRRSEKRDIHPEINLNDACVSHRHAKIQRQPDGMFALLDVGSTNGTHLNGVEIQPAVRTPLHDGDQITLGCWTRILVRGLRG